MEKVRIGINGFGRIGRMVFRAAVNNPKIEICAINDLYDADYLAYMLKYDSTHGLLEGVIESVKGDLFYNGNRIRITNKREAREIGWGEVGVNYVVESTGVNLTSEKANEHLIAGARKVIMSAPPKDDTPLYVMGVNHQNYSGEINIISNASCTTNCLAPIAFVLNENFGIKSGLMSTVHAVTATQKPIDSPSNKDWRGGRGAFQNIIPSTTGAAAAIGKIIPELNGCLTGTSFRVPVSNVSLIDFTVNLKKPTTYDEIKKSMKEASEKKLSGVLGYTEEPVVSSDFIGDKRISIFDANAGMMLGDDFVKIVSWYDNETGYSNKLLDLIQYVHEKSLN